MITKEIFEKLKEKFGDDIIRLDESVKDPFVVVNPQKWLEIAKYLHDDPDLYFDFLMSIAGVDYPDENLIRVVYHLWSYKHRHMLVVKVELNRENPVVDSIDSIWANANWLERETYDLFGVVFKGSRNLKRLLMPEDWEGHPMRKDYEEPKEYHGISTERENPVYLFHLVKPPEEE